MLQRVFLAVPLEAGLKQRIQGLQRKLGRKDKDIRLVKRKDLHLTLNFLGRISQKDFFKLEKWLGEYLQGFSPLKLRVSGLLFLPQRWIRPLRRQVITLAIQPDKRLLLLYNRIREFCRVERIGIKQREEFVPHITLGRLRRPVKLDSLCREYQSFSGVIHFQELVIYNSDFKNYQLLRKYKLCGLRRTKKRQKSHPTSKN